jgi:hypothetical protein
MDLTHYQGQYANAIDREPIPEAIIPNAAKTTPTAVATAVKARTILGFLGSALGLLLGPIGLVAVALIGTGVVAYKAYQKARLSLWMSLLSPLYS